MTGKHHPVGLQGGGFLSRPGGKPSLDALAKAPPDRARADRQNVQDPFAQIPTWATSRADLSVAAAGQVTPETGNLAAGLMVVSGTVPPCPNWMGIWPAG